LRPEPLDRRERLVAIGGLGDDGKSLGLQQRPRGLPKLGVIIDDQHGRTHPAIVPVRAPDRIGASRNHASPDVAPARNLHWPASFRACPVAHTSVAYPCNRRRSDTE
jgi:hypothetical protein